jgi:hypothetical protein
MRTYRKAGRGFDGQQGKVLIQDKERGVLQESTDDVHAIECAGEPGYSKRRDLPPFRGILNQLGPYMR